jgi:hypothetical protein
LHTGNALLKLADTAWHGTAYHYRAEVEEQLGSIFVSSLRAASHFALSGCIALISVMRVNWSVHVPSSAKLKGCVIFLVLLVAFHRRDAQGFPAIYAICDCRNRADMSLFTLPYSKGVIMLGKTIIFTAILALSSCAGMGYAIQHYASVKPEIWQSPTTGTSFRVYDKPQENRMMITLSIGAAAAQGAGRGITLGLADTRTPSIVYQDAAIEWLSTKGRVCSATATSLIVEPQYEVRYNCQNAGAAGAVLSTFKSS